MKAKGILAVMLLVFCVVPVADGWQRQPAGVQPGVTTAQQTMQPPPQPYSGAQQPYGQAYPPAVAYPNQAATSPQAGASQDGPSYPYPPHHNPYYGGTSARDFVNGTIEWFFALPGQAIDTVSNYIDNTFFPQQPATSGGSPQPVSGQAAPPDRTPLPPASAYAPPGR